MSFLIAIITILAFLAASYGWGYATLRWVVRNEVNYISFLSVVGVAIWIFLGGILNLAGIAYPITLYGLLILGLLFFALSFAGRFKVLPTVGDFHLSNDGSNSLLDSLLPLFIVAVAIVFFAVTLLPTDVFNHGDDFQTYIPRAVRMLQIGTLAGNLYEPIGLESLGSQSFLHGFFLLKLPIEFLPGLDTVFCFGLAGFLIAALARWLNLSWVYAMPALLVFLVINPQSVNVSPLYSGTALILGLLFASWLLIEKLNEPKIAQPLSMAALAGLLISSIIALKTTLIFFAAIYAALFCIGLLAITPNKRRALLLSAAMGLAAMITILPWLLLYLPKYVVALTAPSHMKTETKVSGFALPKGHVSELFSSHDLFYGGSTLGYGTLVLGLAILGVFSAGFILRNKNHGKQYGFALVSTSACIAAVTTYFLNGLFFAPEMAIRYSCPVLIAILPFAMLAFSFNLTASPISVKSGSFAHKPLKLVTLFGAILVFALFGSNFYDRIVRAYKHRTTVSFPINDPYIRYNHYVLSEAAQQNIRNIQYRTEVGSKILAWISTPSHLDFARNDIKAIQEAGLINPWLDKDMPFNGSPIEMARYFKEQGIRYILWEYHGGGVKDEDEYEMMLSSPYPIYRRIAERSLYMRRMLKAMAPETINFNHADGILLIDLNKFNL